MLLIQPEISLYKIFIWVSRRLLLHMYIYVFLQKVLPQWNNSTPLLNEKLFLYENSKNNLKLIRGPSRRNLKKKATVTVNLSLPLSLFTSNDINDISISEKFWNSFIKPMEAHGLNNFSYVSICFQFLFYQNWYQWCWTPFFFLFRTGDTKVTLYFIYFLWIWYCNFH